MENEKKIENPQSRREDTRLRAMNIVMDAGSTLLENGGEVFRVQQTMQIMAKSLGFADFQVYVVTNGIFASAQGQGAHEVRYTPSIAVNLAKVEAVNELSRELAGGRLEIPAAEERLAAIRAMPAYRCRTELLAAALGGASFCYLFGGRGAALPAAFLAAGLELLLTKTLHRWKINRIFSDIASAALCTALVLAAKLLLPGLDVNTAIIGALMVLTPGVALVMGIRDFINADYLSGTIRLISALLTAGSLAFGVGFTYTLMRLLPGVTV